MARTVAGLTRGRSARPSDSKRHGAEGRSGDRSRKAGIGLMVGALGVVFGDIGTSPLYAVQTVFSIHQGAVAPTAGGVLGVGSLVFWSKGWR